MSIFPAIILLGLWPSRVSGACNPGFVKKWSIPICPSGSTDTCSEIVKYDSTTQQFFVTKQTGFDIVSMSGVTVGTIEDAATGGVTSLDVFDGQLAVAWVNQTKTDPGEVRFYQTSVGGAKFQSAVTVGALPDMVTFTPSGSHLLVANEGEPNDAYDIDPVGSVSIINVAARTSKTVDFSSYNGKKADLAAKHIRVFGPGASVAQDFEPEFIATDALGQTAWVTLQENNGIAIVDIATATVKDIIGAGIQDHNSVLTDPSDKDGGLNMKNGNVKTFNLPDAIVSFEVDGVTYYATANEGDTRDYGGYSEETRGAGLTLDPKAYPDAAFFQQSAEFGRLKVTTSIGDADSDGDVDQMWGFGGRGFSIFHGGDMTKVYDSGSLVTSMYKKYFPSRWNDDRADDKGSEAEGLTVGTVDGHVFLFVAMERTSDVFVYDVSSPMSPKLAAVLSGDGDVSPEGLDFISAADSPTGNPMVAIAYEVSHTLAVYEATSRCFEENEASTCGDVKQFYKENACCGNPSKAVHLEL